MESDWEAIRENFGSSWKQFKKRFERRSESSARENQKSIVEVLVKN